MTTNSPKTPRQPRPNYTPARTGKIARLPHEIRLQLNQRLQDGETGPDILKWLNPLPEVQKVLKDRFESRPISIANLSEWRIGGFQDWMVLQNNLTLVRSLQDKEGFGHRDLGDGIPTKISNWAALHYASCAQVLVAAECEPELRWERLHRLCTDMTRLRRTETFADRLALDHKWLALEKSNSAEAKKKLYQQWAKRAEKTASAKKRRGLSRRVIRQIQKAMGLDKMPTVHAPADARARLQAAVDAPPFAYRTSDPTKSNQIVADQTKNGKNEPTAHLTAEQPEPTLSPQPPPPPKPLAPQPKPYHAEFNTFPHFTSTL